VHATVRNASQFILREAIEGFVLARPADLSLQPSSVKRSVLAEQNGKGTPEVAVLH
jgi:hypothetical protein